MYGSSQALARSQAAPQQQLQAQGPRGSAQLQAQGPRGSGHDPFGVFDDMMMSPFGSRMGGRGSGGGGGLFGDMFGHMDQMMQEMNAMAQGAGGQMSAVQGGRDGGVMLRGMGAGGGGAYSCQTMTFSSTRGPDGKMHTERFSSSAVGDTNRQMQEVQQAYSNSSSGVDKMSLERQLQGRGRKMVKEYSRHSGEERNTDMFRGMTEEQCPEFDRRWQAEAAPHLPAHMGHGVRALAGSPAHSVPAPGRGAPSGRAALPAPPLQQQSPWASCWR